MIECFGRKLGTKAGDQRRGRVKIDLVFDTVCPWCYVGKRRLERALALRPGFRPNLHWRPYILNPNIPPEGMDHQTYLNRKFGNPTRIQRMQGAVAKAGADVGIDFAFDSIQFTPNTLHSHRLIRYAARTGHEGAMVEAIYNAYFCQGRDISNIAELTEISEEVGLPPAEIASYLQSDCDITATINDNAHVHHMGITGVPCLIINGEYAMAGAQDSDILVRLMDIAHEQDVEAAIS